MGRKRERGSRGCSVTLDATRKVAKICRFRRTGRMSFGRRRSISGWRRSTAEKAEQLDELAGESDTPRWSPDGKRIAFRSNRKDHSFIAVLDLATKKISYLAPTTNRDAGPVWSPDSKQVAFIRQHGVEFKRPLIPEFPRPWALWIADAQSAEGRELFHSGNAMEDSLPLFAFQSLQFTNAGRIIFASEKDGRNHLYSIAATGGVLSSSRRATLMSKKWC